MPMKAFHVGVETVKEGAKILEVLADYDQFQLDNNIKPDYCNAGGLMMFDTEDKEDSPEGSWVDWCDDQTGIESPAEYVEWAAGA